MLRDAISLATNCNQSHRSTEWLGKRHLDIGRLAIGNITKLIFDLLSVRLNLQLTEGHNPALSSRLGRDNACTMDIIFATLTYIL
jgi:hypothetical protein